MRKRRCTVLLAALLLSLSACAPDSSGDSGSAESTTAETTAAETTSAPETELYAAVESETGTYAAEAPTVQAALTCRMTDYERACVEKRPFSLLDDAAPAPEVKIGTMIVTKEARIAMYQSWAESGQLTEEELQQSIAEDAEGYSYQAAMLNGVLYNYYIPPDGYDGGRIEFENGVSFDDMEAFFADTEATYCKDCGMSKAKTETFLKEMRTVFDAVINGTYVSMPDRYQDFTVPFQPDDPFADRRTCWQYDKDALAEIKDHIEEYQIYDEQLGLPFLVYVTLPPHYDAANTYPVMLLTDGVWRLNDHAAMYQAMENGEAADVILVSLSYSYNIMGTDNQFRDKLLIDAKDRLLSFITDDLMPYLGEQYHIDCTASTLFGHSMGGVFSHYACFMSDTYENQPFFRYIVGSPALFNLYGPLSGGAGADAEREYGYFDRNDTLTKKIFLCGGSLEDPDYADSYNGHDSLLTGLSKMKDRIAAQKADFTYKLYESHHYQYVPTMLLEYLKAAYPAQ